MGNSTGYWMLLVGNHDEELLIMVQTTMWSVYLWATNTQKTGGDKIDSGGDKTLLLINGGDKIETQKNIWLTGIGTSGPSQSYGNV